RFYFEWDWARAEKEYRELVDEPGLLRGEVWRPMTLYFWARGRTDESITLMERALRNDPGDLASQSMLADFLAHARHPDDAVGRYRAVAEAEPYNPSPLFGLAPVLRRRGEMAGALEALRKAYTLAHEDEGARALAGARTEDDYAKAEATTARSRLARLE